MIVPRYRVTLYFEEADMGMVYAEITLKNALDVGKARDGLIPEQEVRFLTVTAVVDTDDSVEYLVL